MYHFPISLIMMFWTYLASSHSLVACCLEAFLWSIFIFWDINLVCSVTSLILMSICFDHLVHVITGLLLNAWNSVEVLHVCITTRLFEKTIRFRKTHNGNNVFGTATSNSCQSTNLTLTYLQIHGYLLGKDVWGCGKILGFSIADTKKKSENWKIWSRFWQYLNSILLLLNFEFSSITNKSKY